MSCSSQAGHAGNLTWVEGLPSVVGPLKQGLRATGEHQTEMCRVPGGTGADVALLLTAL